MFVDQLCSSFGIPRFVQNEHSDVSEKRTIHLYMHVNSNCTLRLEAIFVPVTSENSHVKRLGNSNVDNKQQKIDLATVNRSNDF
jgi:hypothetical protein